MIRNCEFKIRMTRDELATLDKKVRKTSMSREGYARTVLNGKTPVQLPTADYYALIREVRALGNIMYQIAYKVNTTGLCDALMYKQNAALVTALADKLTTVCLPRSE